jgi:hypothetical protein
MRRPLPAIAWLAVVATLAAAACGPSGSPTPTATPTPAPTEAPSATPVPSGFGGAPYDITVPGGWQAFNLADPAVKAGLEALVKTKPTLAASIKQFESMTNARIAVNPVLGVFLLVITTPSAGIPLETLAQGFTEQFQAVAGLQATPAPENITLPGGEAIHWVIKLSSTTAEGGTISAADSIYLFASASDAVVIEFITPTGGSIPDEQAIVNSFRFID